MICETTEREHPWAGKIFEHMTINCDYPQTSAYDSVSRLLSEKGTKNKAVYTCVSFLCFIQF